MLAIYVFIAATYTPWLVLLELGIDNIYGKIMAVFVWAVSDFIEKINVSDCCIWCH
jgi:predicted membrane channel-forming protein YqfA (hemolysin III family)